MKISTQTKKLIIKDLKENKLTSRQMSLKYRIARSTIYDLSKTIGLEKTECPLTKYRKFEIKWLYNNFCKHGNRYTDHYHCFLKEKDGQIGGERIGLFDIEASNLSADFGICLCYRFTLLNSGKVFGATITPQDLKSGAYDKRLIEQFVKDCKQFDRLVGHYSSRFDIPYMRTRAIIQGVPFPAYGELHQSDTWRIARDKLKLSSNRLKTIETAFKIEHSKTQIMPEHWLGALSGNQKAINYIGDHCTLDVQVLEEVYNKIEKYAHKTNTSI